MPCPKLRLTGNPDQSKSRVMTKRKEPTKRYGIWREATPRKGDCWRYRVRVMGANGRMVRRYAAGFATKAEAEAAVAKLTLDGRARKHGIAVEVPAVIPTIQQAVDDYIASISARWRAKRGEAYVHRNKGQLQPIRNWAEFAGPDRLVNTVTKDDLIFWYEHEVSPERGLQTSSFRRRINSIRAALNHAKEHCPALATYRVPKRPTGMDAETNRLRILSQEEIASLSDAMRVRPDWRNEWELFQTALACGARIHELLPIIQRKGRSGEIEWSGIKWQDIDERQGLLTLIAYKTDGKTRTLYLPAVVELLMRRKRDGLGNATHAFGCVTDHRIRKVFAYASTAAGLLYGQQRHGAEGWSVHDLRHTCLSALLHAGVDLASVRDFAGHHSIAETTKYLHPSAHSRELAAAASASLLALTAGSANGDSTVTV